MMMNDARTYERMFLAFDMKGQETMGYEELQQTMDSLPASESMGRKRFFPYLLGQKRRQGVLLRFFGKCFWTLSVAAVAIAFMRRPRPSPPVAAPSTPAPRA